MAAPTDDARALILAGAIVTSSGRYDPFVYREAPPVYRTLPAVRPPLDLDAPRFRYERVDGRLVAVREAYGCRYCDAPHVMSRRFHGAHATRTPGGWPSSFI